jgi:hypothetical protein
MKDENAQALLAKVMGWDSDDTINYVPQLQLLADFKYDQYQRFAPGKRFIESLALWLNQFAKADRQTAFDFVLNELVFLSEQEIAHLVQTAYADHIIYERIRLISEENDIPQHCVAKIVRHDRFKELQIKSLYLGLSDGARTNDLRRASDGEIGNEQIWQAYELGEEKAADMKGALVDSLTKEEFSAEPGKFNLIWLIDDFSGSGNTYIRYEDGGFKGKIKKVYDQLHSSELVDSSHYEVFLLLYVATRQAIDHIEYWAGLFTSEKGYKPLQVRVLCVIERSMSVTSQPNSKARPLLANEKYCDQTYVDKHFRVGGTDDVRFGFAGCALPVVLNHNTPNNSVFILWGPESSTFSGLFPRVSRHREV